MRKALSIKIASYSSFDFSKELKKQQQKVFIISLSSRALVTCRELYIKSLGECFVLCCRMTQIGVGSTILHVSVFVAKTSDTFKIIKRQEKNLWMVKLSLFKQFL